VTVGDDDKAGMSDEERDAIGGCFSTARHRPETPATTAAEATEGRKAKQLNGPPGDVDSGAQVAHEDDDPADASYGDENEEMTAAEAAGQVAYGSGDPNGPTTPTGVESSSG
jgi:hypothetical protein